MNDNQESMCPDGRCDDMDARDVVIDGSDAYVAEHGKGRLLKGTVGKGGFLTSLNPDEADAPSVVLSPSGIGVSPQELAITGETLAEADAGKTDSAKLKGVLYMIPRPGKEHDDAAQDQSCLRGNEGQQKLKPGQHSQSGTQDQTSPSRAISAGLHCPSGIAWDGSEKHFYVADDDDADDSVRWSIFTKQKQGWVPDGLLASVPKLHRTMPKFLGIALASELHTILAAGPMGLFAFRPDGESIGTISFDEPVNR